jgi:hypothetical protein
MIEHAILYFIFVIFPNLAMAFVLVIYVFIIIGIIGAVIRGRR